MHSEKVPYFILDLLQQVPSVYVQGLGRFDAIFHPAVIDLEASQIKPPGLHADFVPDIEEETEILSAYMHYVSGVSVNDAKDHISTFVNNVLHQVNSGEPYTIEKFGTFSKSSAHVLHFTPDWDAFNLSFKGMEVIDLYPVKEKTQEDVYIRPSIPIPEPAEYSFEKIITESIDHLPSNEFVTKEPVMEVMETETKDEPIIATNPEINESTTRLAWAILTSSLILITVLCAYLAWDIISDRKRINQRTQLYSDTLAITNELDIPVKMDSTVTSNTSNTTVTETPPEVKPDTVEEPVVQEPSQPPCFIVVGAFSSQENVTRMMERLKGMGYTSEQIKGGALTRVAISTSCDKSNLQKVLSEARSSINPEAWIY